MRNLAIEAHLLELIEVQGTHGMTWKELDDVTNYSHGPIFGALSALHGDGKVFYLNVLRNGKHPYVIRSIRGEFDNRDCQDRPRPNISTRILTKIVNAYENYEDLAPLIEEAKGHIYK